MLTSVSSSMIGPSDGVLTVTVTLNLALWRRSLLGLPAWAFADSTAERSSCWDKTAKRRRKATLASYLTKIAQLRNYLARTKEPPPGNAVKWRGPSRLTDIELGLFLDTQLVGN